MESTVAQKLDALQKLQAIDSKLDEIKKVRGALPDEVLDLEDEIAGYETRIDRFDESVKAINDEIDASKQGMKDSDKLITKYGEQQMNVRNNREYDAITKETELQQLEIQILEKRITESQVKIEDKKSAIEETKQLHEDRKKDLAAKKVELETIEQESEDDVKKLEKDREKALKGLEDRLSISYQKLRDNVRNGLAVVAVKRGACGGCFNTVPPQRQADIRERKKVIVCEHCGRLLADVEDEVIEEKPKKKRTTRKTTVKKTTAE
ncbi:MAG: putative nucleic acid-binding Zn-ribbon protein [Marivirga sp.]|jgi:predicted  nucleic acid-binding Zn-ribbon protein